MKINKLLLLALLPVAFASCDDTDAPVETFEDTFSANITYSRNLSTGDAALLKGSDYRMVFDFTNYSLQVSVSDLNYAEGAAPLSFNLPATPFKFSENGAYVINVPSYTFSSGADTHTVTDFTFTVLNRVYTQGNYRIVDATFTLDGNYSIRSVQEDLLYFAQTKVSKGGVVTYQSTTPFYTVDYDRLTQLADLTIYQAKFMAQQPAMDMVFPNIPFTLDEKGQTLDCESLVPTINDVPYPQYAITDLHADLDPHGLGTLSFDCTVQNDMIPEPTVFHVEVTFTLLRQ